MSPFRLMSAAVAILVALPAHAENVRGRVIGISDGDTLTVLIGERPLRVRLAEIDAPEAGQAYGRAAKSALSALIWKRTVTADIVTYDRYGRAVALVSLTGININAEMVRSGFAWAYVAYQTDTRFSLLEARARAQKRGLWQDTDPIPPWRYRRSARG